MLTMVRTTNIQHSNCCRRVAAQGKARQSCSLPAADHRRPPFLPLALPASFEGTLGPDSSASLAGSRQAGWAEVGHKGGRPICSGKNVLPSHGMHALHELPMLNMHASAWPQHLAPTWHGRIGAVQRLVHLASSLAALDLLRAIPCQTELSQRHV